MINGFSQRVKIQTYYQHVNLPSRDFDALAFESHVYTGIPTVSDLHVNNDIPPIIETSDDLLSPLLNLLYDQKIPYFSFLIPQQVQ